jgi:hypothetical protein
LLTAERNVAICHPLHVNQIATLPRVRVASVLVWVFAVLFNNTLFWESLYAVIPVENQPETYSYITNTKTYVIVFKVVLRILVNTVLPFILMTFFTARVLLKMSRSFEEQKKFVGKTEKEVAEMGKRAARLRRTRVVLVSIIVTFVVLDLTTPAAWCLMPTLYDFPPPQIYTLYYAQHKMEYVQYICQVTKSCLNYFLFGVAGKKYREVIKNACSCKRGRNV